jgi:hypothetical protein
MTHVSDHRADAMHEPVRDHGSALGPAIGAIILSAIWGGYVLLYLWEIVALG